jgi:ferredoxin-type protein NapH
MRTGKDINPHSLCPYSIVCFGIPASIGKLSVSPFIITIGISIIILLSTLVIGRFFCGWICPLGTLQRFIHSIGKKRTIKLKPDVENRIHNKAVFFKYAILLSNILVAFKLLQSTYMHHCPIISVTNLGILGIVAGIYLLLLGIMSIYIERFFCKYVCPYAALMNLMQMLGKVLRIPRYKITVKTDLCIDCKLCNKHCPMQLEINKHDVVDEEDCIMCARCQNSCPQDGGINFKIKK